MYVIFSPGWGSLHPRVCIFPFGMSTVEGVIETIRRSIRTGDRGGMDRLASIADYLKLRKRIQEEGFYEEVVFVYPSLPPQPGVRVEWYKQAAGLPMKPKWKWPVDEEKEAVELKKMVIADLRAKLKQAQEMVSEANHELTALEQN